MMKLVVPFMAITRDEQGHHIDIMKWIRYADRYLYNNLLVGLLLLLFGLIADTFGAEMLGKALLAASAPFAILSGFSLGIKDDGILR